MYAPAVSEEMNYAGDLGLNIGHHDCAHHGSSAGEISALKTINGMHLGLLKHLINLLKTEGLMKDSLVLFGSDMSDGNTHRTTDIPTLLCGEGADLKFGQVVSPAAPEPYSKLLNSILSNYGVTVPSMGEGDLLSSANINSTIKT